MKFAADLHIHSHFSRATSKLCTLPYLAYWAQVKGIQVIGTGDFTHPGWLKELKNDLIEVESGLFRLESSDSLIVDQPIKPGNSNVRFVLSAEISCIYKVHNRVRKNHHLILAPGYNSVDHINKQLSKIGNLAADGRPILKIDSRDLLEIVLESSPDAMLIPAHIWTPWFSVFGNRSGFDSIEECFRDLASHITTLETGLSADPKMIRLISALDQYTLMSNSDAHSPMNLGREATVFNTDFSFQGIIKSLRKNTNLCTIEFFPEEGKYYSSGHRKCSYRLEDQKVIPEQNLCPVCLKPLTIGVMQRILQLADRDPKADVKHERFVSTLGLIEIISQVFRVGPKSKKVMRAYTKLINQFGSEFNILFEVPLIEFTNNNYHTLERAISKIRSGLINKSPGYDGEYGNLSIFDSFEITHIPKTHL